MQGLASLLFHHHDVQTASGGGAALGVCCRPKCKIWSSDLSKGFLTNTQFFFFTNQSSTQFPGISGPCNQALTAPVWECPLELLNLVGGDHFYTLHNETVMDVLCRPQCPTALASYRSAVVTACANDNQPRAGYPATYWVDAVSSVQAQMCLKDSATGEYCTGKFNIPKSDVEKPG